MLTPHDHTSAALPSYRLSNSTSGAMYSGVPMKEEDTGMSRWMLSYLHLVVTSTW